MRYGNGRKTDAPAEVASFAMDAPAEVATLAIDAAAEVASFSMDTASDRTMGSSSRFNFLSEHQQSRDTYFDAFPQREALVRRAQVQPRKEQRKCPRPS